MAVRAPPVVSNSTAVTTAVRAAISDSNSTAVMRAARPAISDSNSTAVTIAARGSSVVSNSTAVTRACRAPSVVSNSTAVMMACRECSPVSNSTAVTIAARPAVRNAIVHKAGKADREFLRRVTNSRRLSAIHEGQSIPINGLLLSELVPPVIIKAVEFQNAVGVWICDRQRAANESDT